MWYEIWKYKNQGLDQNPPLETCWNQLRAIESINSSLPTKNTSNSKLRKKSIHDVLFPKIPEYKPTNPTILPKKRFHHPFHPFPFWGIPNHGLPPTCNTTPVGAKASKASRQSTPPVVDCNKVTCSVKSVNPSTPKIGGLEPKNCWILGKTNGWNPKNCWFAIRWFLLWLRAKGTKFRFHEKKLRGCKWGLRWFLIGKWDDRFWYDMKWYMQIIWNKNPMFQKQKKIRHFFIQTSYGISSDRGAIIPPTDG